MFQALHAGSAAALLLAHATFLARGIHLRRSGARPRRLDRWARLLSQLLLPATALTGLPAMGQSGPATLLPHVLVGLLPLGAVPLVFFLRVALRRRRELPWLLPVLNLILILAAAGTGVAAAG